MKVQSWRTVDLAREAGLSAQQVRNYESLGFIPRAPRSPAGYRLFGEQHLDALVTARTLIRGYGWEEALRVMQAAHAGRRDEVLALVDARHAALDARRRRADEVLSALEALRGVRTAVVARDSGDGVVDPVPAARPPAGRPGRPRPPGGLRIGEAASALGVAASSIRYWEQRGLLEPERDRQSGYRRYQAEQLVRLQVVALLRAERYGFDLIRLALEGFGSSGATGRAASERAVEAVEVHRARIAAQSRRCMQATAELWTYLQQQDRGAASWVSPSS